MRVMAGSRNSGGRANPRGGRGGAASRAQQSVSASASVNERLLGTSEGLDQMHCALLSGYVFNDRVTKEPHCRLCGCNQWETYRPHNFLRILPPLLHRRLHKARNASKNAVAQKTNQHAALVAKVARWTAELGQARQTMFDLAVELLDVEPAEDNARISHEAASAAQPEEFKEIMDVDKDLDEMQVSARGGRGGCRAPSQAGAALWQVARVTQRGYVVVVGGACGMDLPKVSGDPSQASCIQSKACRRGRPYSQPKDVKGRCSRALVGCGAKRSLDILFNNIKRLEQEGSCLLFCSDGPASHSSWSTMRQPRPNTVRRSGSRTVTAPAHRKWSRHHWGHWCHVRERSHGGRVLAVGSGSNF